jgi:sugar lactone lactonase YvrE
MRFFRRTMHVAVLLILLVSVLAAQDGRKKSREGKGERAKGRREAVLPEDVATLEEMSVILGCPTDKSVAVSALSRDAIEGYIEYGAQSGAYSNKTDKTAITANTPVTVVLESLKPNTRYYYRLRYHKPGEESFAEGVEHSFHTQRAPGSTFSFEIQGDSHPERPQMYDAELYARTLRAAAAEKPDFYMTIGDDFSVDTLRTVNADTVREVYLYQRPFLALVAHSSPLFLVNGNHEQAAAYNLDGTPDNVAVWAQSSRNKLFPQPAPDDFYTGDEKPVEFIGMLRDYYAWTWGDALFVVIDPYWHSPEPVDNELGSREKARDMWAITLGDEQYKWLKETLERSKAKYKFVFAHHVLGTGRGGVEMADLCEWGGKNRKGRWEFNLKRPGWEMPIHQLMAKNKVTIFFQGHDHIFVKQEKDGVIYQTLPVPADPNYSLFNRDAYETGEALPNSGRTRVTVSPEQVTVEYIRSYLPKDETEERKNDEIAFKYIVGDNPGDDADGEGTGKDADARSQESIVPAGAEVTEISSEFRFTEGPAVDANGSVFFSDVQASKTYRMSPEGKISVFCEDSGGANGLAFDRDGNLIACEGGNGRIVSISLDGRVSVLADKYDGKRFNQPNDLWLDPKGGIYFSDPVYSGGERIQDGEHVYYISPDRKKVTRVISDMVRPNGLVGTPDGKTLYVADHGAGKTYRYAVAEDGSLRDKTLFVSKGSDGMTMDSSGNVYITGDAILIYNPAGEEVGKIEVPNKPTNLCFCGADGRTLFITARTAIYRVELNAKGVSIPREEK